MDSSQERYAGDVTPDGGHIGPYSDGEQPITLPLTQQVNDRKRSSLLIGILSGYPDKVGTILDDKIGTLYGLAKGMHPAAKGGLDTVQALRMARDTADSALTQAVAQARAEGESWQAIGKALGTTRQSAYERYGTQAAPPRERFEANVQAMNEARAAADKAAGW